MTPSISDLFLAYRQAKTALYFERRGVGLLDLAKFESRLSERLPALRSLLSRQGGWFREVPIGEVFVTPKRLHLRSVSSNEVIRIGEQGSGRESLGVDVQLRLTPSPEFAIVEVLYLWSFGPALDALLSKSSLGYRLDLRGGAVSRSRRWLFEYWPRRYEEFRTTPLQTARKELATGPVVIVSADLESFYDTVAPSFLIDESFLRNLQEVGAKNGVSVDLDEYVAATRSLLSALQSYRTTARRLTGVDWPTGIPIGALTSRVIANVSSAPLDTSIAGQPHVAMYRRYVDDFVIIGKGEGGSFGFDDTLAHYLPCSSPDGDTVKFDGLALGREGSDFRLRREKTRIHHLSGIQGVDFLAAIEKDFGTLVSERRAFLDTSSLLDDVSSQLIHAGKGGQSPLRVLRDADRTKLEHFALSNALRTLERVSVLVDPASACDLAQQTLERLGRFLEGEDDWVENLDLAFRLLRLAAGLEDSRDFRQLCDRMDVIWGSTDRLKSSAGTLRHRGRVITSQYAWKSMRRYLHARRIEAVCTALRPPKGLLVPHNWMPGGVRDGRRSLGSRALVDRARLLAAADLRARDREDDDFGLNPHTDRSGPELLALVDENLSERFAAINKFVERCDELGDRAWSLSPAGLFLCTRPPSYFDIARRWLYRTETAGFEHDVFSELLEVVNAVRGTEYRDPVGNVIDASTVDLNGDAGEGLQADSESRLILGNLVVSPEAFRRAATRSVGSQDGKPLITMKRLESLAHVLSRSSTASRAGASRQRRIASLLVLPELSLPRRWFRTVANHVVRLGEFGLVTGLEYRHDWLKPAVWNQVYAVLPGPFGSVATWPWTKFLPAREEARQLGELKPPVSFPRPRRPGRQRTVVHSRYGKFSVLVCSELIECRRTADLLGRVELVLSPSWNQDTSSYDHLIRSVALQLHAIVAIANNGHYSDCRAWAPRYVRWERDLCRLIQRDIDDIVVVDLPLQSLRKSHSGRLEQSELSGASAHQPQVDWQPRPPDWP